MREKIYNVNKYPSFRQFITGQAAPPIILCIGSPKVPGDSFGPITGKLLCERFFVPTVVYGTCDCPVHALNLTAELEKIRLIHPDRKIIAVDSAICASVRTGTLSAFPGSIHPGLAAGKDLGAVGDWSLTATVAKHDKSELFSIGIGYVYALSVKAALMIKAAFPDGSARAAEKRIRIL